MYKNSIRFRHLQLAGLVVAASLVIAPGLQASEVPTARVAIADLDLATDHAQQVLARRVYAAIARVCAPATSAPLVRPAARRAMEQCRYLAFDGVQQQLVRHGLPQLGTDTTG